MRYHLQGASVSVSVAVNVEQESSAAARFQKVMTCLGRSKSASRCVSPTQGPAKNSGRRELQRQAHVCKHNGRAVSCSDGVRNGNELMADCGGSCNNLTDTQGSKTKCLTAVERELQALTAANAGRFDVRTPYGISRLSTKELFVLSNQRLSISCTSMSSETCEWPTKFTMKPRASGLADLRLDRMLIQRQPGAIQTQSGANVLSVSRSALSRNSQSHSGGSINFAGGLLNVSSSTFNDNHATGDFKQGGQRPMLTWSIYLW